VLHRPLRHHVRLKKRTDFLARSDFLRRQITSNRQRSAPQHSDMPSVVFLRAVNVGGTNRCRPAEIAKDLAGLGVVNIGAVGTFVVREDVSESELRAAIAKKLPFKCDM